MLNNVKLYFILVFIPLIFFACSATKAPLTPQQEADLLYDKAVQLQDLESYDEASAQFEEYVRRYPESISADNAKIQIANAYYQQGKYDEAINEYKDIIEKYPDSDAADHALISIGDVYFAQEKYSEAIEAYKKLIQKYPRFSVKLTVDAQDRIDAIKSIEEDLKIISQGNENEKDDAQYDIAEIYFKVFRNYERAKEEYQKVVDKWPKVNFLMMLYGVSQNAIGI